MTEPQLIANVTELLLSEIEVGKNRVRPFSETAVETLVQVIHEYGSVSYTHLTLPTN